MKLLWSDAGWEDYIYWQENNQTILRRINTLIGDIRRNRFRGIGKPEPLHDNLSGWWSRRITSDHRLVYRIAGTGDNQQIEMIMCRYNHSRRR